MDKKTEIRQLLKLSPDEVQAQAGERLIVCPDINELQRRMAKDITGAIQSGNANNGPTRLILPVGPTGQYPILADILNRKQIPLSRCWFFFMDEYCDESGRAVGIEHPLSFKRVAESLFLSKLDDGLGLRREQVFFPDENNVEELPSLIEQIGGIDICFGGIGIHGHVAFNEPEPGVKNMSARQVTLNDFTVTINAVRSKVGGNLETYPRQAYTLGMHEILAARQIRLYCRNGCEFDWANAVLRLALFGAPSDDYPVTHIRGLNYVIVTDRDTLASPEYII